MSFAAAVILIACLAAGGYFLAVYLSHDLDNPR